MTDTMTVTDTMTKVRNLSEAEELIQTYDV